MLFMVYGTLKAGHGNNYLLTESGATASGTATVEGFTLYEVRGGYFPLAVSRPGERVTGEVWDVPTAGPGVQRLDRLEGVPHHYTRETVTTTDGREVQLYVYASDPAAQGLPHVGETWPVERPAEEQQSAWAGWMDGGGPCDHGVAVDDFCPVCDYDGPVWEADDEGEDESELDRMAREDREDYEADRNPFLGDC